MFTNKSHSQNSNLIWFDVELFHQIPQGLSRNGRQNANDNIFLDSDKAIWTIIAASLAYKAFTDESVGVLVHFAFKKSLPIFYQQGILK